MSEKSPNDEYEDVAREVHNAYILIGKIFSQQINCKSGRKEGREGRERKREREEGKERKENTPSKREIHSHVCGGIIHNNWTWKHRPWEPYAK